MVFEDYLMTKALGVPLLLLFPTEQNDYKNVREKTPSVGTKEGEITSYIPMFRGIMTTD
jgi:hypothetical protein